MWSDSHSYFEKMKNNQLSRREFLHKSTIAAAAFSAGAISVAAYAGGNIFKGKGKMPMRQFGKTGEKVSILGYGGGSQFMLMPDGEWEPHLQYALDAGINYFDTASSYGADSPKTSEMRYGEILPSYRKKILLLTKIDKRDIDGAKKEVETSLKNLKTDYIDILLIHAITPDDTLSGIESGIYKYFTELKEQKVVRFIGFSSMDSAERAKELIENLDFDVTLLAMNPTKYRNFADIALPSARKKNLGVIAMKIMRNIVNQNSTPKELLEYAWNLPGVSCGLVSQTGLTPLKQNIEIARDYIPGKQSDAVRKNLESRLAHLGGPHVLEWAREGYNDGILT
jgi:predicted aldo/keto reductase-like oxidoreductase